MISVSLIEVIGVIEDGITLLLSLNIDENIYQFIYWINRDMEYKIAFDDNFLKDFNIKSVDEITSLDDLALYINVNIIGSIDDLFEKFYVKEDGNE